LSGLDNDELALYNAIKAVILEIADGIRTKTDGILLENITINHETTDDTSTAEEELGNFLRSKIRKVMNMILADCPYELYWFGKTKGYQFSYSYSVSGNTYTIENLELSFSVASDYAQKSSDNTYNQYSIDTTQVERAKAAKAKATYELTVAKKSLKPSVSGTVTKKYDGTTSVDKATENTLAIVLDGVLESDKSKIQATADFEYEDAAVGDNTGGSTGGTTGGNTGSNTPVPTTPAPVTPAPATPVPATPVPATPAPAVPTPEPAQDTVKTDTVTNPDGSVTKTVTETDDSGKVVQVTQTTTNTDGTVKEVVNKTGTNSESKDVNVTTVASPDKAATATASLTMTVRSGNKSTLSKSVIDQIAEAAENANTKITVTVKDSSGNVRYTVKTATADLTTGKNLYIYQLNTKTGEYITSVIKYRMNFQYNSIFIQHKILNLFIIFFFLGRLKEKY